VIRDGKTGFIVENVEQAVHAVAHLDVMDRAAVRATFERRFSVEVMAAKYEDAYADVIVRNDTRRLHIAATEDRKLTPASASPHAVPVRPRVAIGEGGGLRCRLSPNAQSNDRPLVHAASEVVSQSAMAAEQG
jgi:hypothetical protein